MVRSKDLTVRYSFIQFFTWVCFSPIMGYASVFLLGKGFSNTTIGVVSACGGILSAFLQPIVASYADKEKSISIKWISSAIVLVILLSAVAITLSGEVVIVEIVFFALLITAIQMIVPFINSLGMESINAGYRLNFGASRGAGSLGYAVISVLLGKFMERFGVDLIPASILLFSSALLFSILFFPFRKPDRELPVLTQEKASKGFFKKYPMFLLFVIGILFTFMGHNVINLFAYQIIQFKGGNESNMGVSIAIAAASEIPVMFGFLFLLKRFKSSTLVKVGSFAMFLKTLATFFADSMMEYYLIQMIQAFGFGMFIVAQAYYVNEIMDENDKIKGQAMITTCGTVGVVSTFLIGGTVIDILGVRYLMVQSVLVATIGLLLIVISEKKMKKQIQMKKDFSKH